MEAPIQSEFQDLLGFSWYHQIKRAIWSLSLGLWPEKAGSSLPTASGGSEIDQPMGSQGLRTHTSTLALELFIMGTPGLGLGEAGWDWDLRITSGEDV